MTTGITKQNLIRILQEDPALLEELRELVLTRELIELPQKFAEYAEASDKRFAKIEQTLDRLSETLNEYIRISNERFNGLDNDIGYLKGLSLENTLAGRGRGKIEYSLNLRSTRVQRVVTYPNISHEFEDAIFEAEDNGTLTPRERRRIIATDMIMRGRYRDTGEQVYVVVEASFTAGRGDIDRAGRSADAMQKMFPDANVAAVVYYANISDDIKRMADNEGVRTVSNERMT